MEVKIENKDNFLTRNVFVKDSQSNSEAYSWYGGAHIEIYHDNQDLTFSSKEEFARFRDVINLAYNEIFS